MLKKDVTWLAIAYLYLGIQQNIYSLKIDFQILEPIRRSLKEIVEYIGTKIYISPNTKTKRKKFQSETIFFKYSLKNLTFRIKKNFANY